MRKILPNGDMGLPGNIDGVRSSSMEPTSPYQAPSSQMMPQPPPHVLEPMIHEPGSIKVFGIMHLVVSAYGILMGVIGLVGTMFFQGMSKGLASGSMPGGPSSSEQETAMMQYMNELKPFTYVSLAFSFFLAAMLIIAGIGLLKSRNSGRLLSIRYAWLSIITKLITLVYTFTHVIPATKRMTETLYQGMPGAMSNTMGSVMQYSQVFSILITFTYPVVVLFMMKSEKVRQYLAGR